MARGGPAPLWCRILCETLGADWVVEFCPFHSDVSLHFCTSPPGQGSFSLAGGGTSGSYGAVRLAAETLLCALQRARGPAMADGSAGRWGRTEVEDLAEFLGLGHHAATLLRVTLSRLLRMACIVHRGCIRVKRVITSQMITSQM